MSHYGTIFAATYRFRLRDLRKVLFCKGLVAIFEKIGALAIYFLSPGF